MAYSQKEKERERINMKIGIHGETILDPRHRGAQLVSELAFTSIESVSNDLSLLQPCTTMSTPSANPQRPFQERMDVPSASICPGERVRK